MPGMGRTALEQEEVRGKDAYFAQTCLYPMKRDVHRYRTSEEWRK